MSALPMYKTCPNCGRKFSCNPSIGNISPVCPHCGKPVGFLFTEIANALMKLNRR